MPEEAKLIRATISPRQRPVAAVTSPVVTLPDAGASLRHMFNIVRRQKLRLVLFVVVALALTTGICFIVSPLFEASSYVEVERRNNTAVIGQEASQSSPVDDMDQVMTTLLAQVQSDVVLRPVADKYHLLDQENQLKDLLGRPLPPNERQEKLSAPVELKRLKVSRPPNSYLLRISYKATNATFAAEVANAIAESFISNASQTRVAKNSNVIGLMNRQLAELKTRLADSAEQISKYEQDLTVIDSQQRTTMLANRLNLLTTNYTAAQEERMHKEAELGVVHDGSLAAAQISTQADALNRAVDRRNEAESHLVEIASTYGVKHPEYRKAATQVEELNRQIEDLRSNIASRTERSYRQALGHEKMVAAALKKTKQEFEHLSARALAFERLKQDAENDKKLYDDLIQRIREQDINTGYQNSIIHISDRGRPASKPAFPNIPVFLAVAFILSLTLGSGWMVLSDAVDSRLMGAEVAAMRMNVGLISKLPTFKRALTASAFMDASLQTAPKSERGVHRFHESVKTLLRTIVLSVDCERVRTIAFTSTAPGEGKTTVCSHLALAASEMRKKTLLIDADVRRGTAHRFFQVALTPGLADVMVGHTSWRDAVVPVEGQPYLYLLPAGRSSRAALEEFHFGMPELLEKAVREYDLIIIDAPPVDFAESVELAALADGMIMVANSGTTTAGALQGLISKLQLLGANILGLALNQTREDWQNYYYHGYYSSPKEPEVAVK